MDGCRAFCLVEHRLWISSTVLHTFLLDGDASAFLKVREAGCMVVVKLRAERGFSA